MEHLRLSDGRLIFSFTENGPSYCTIWYNKQTNLWEFENTCQEIEAKRIEFTSANIKECLEFMCISTVFSVGAAITDDEDVWCRYECEKGAGCIIEIASIEDILQLKDMLCKFVDMFDSAFSKDKLLDFLAGQKKLHARNWGSDKDQ